MTTSEAERAFSKLRSRRETRQRASAGQKRHDFLALLSKLKISSDKKLTSMMLYIILQKKKKSKKIKM